MSDDDTRSAENFTDEPETTGLPTAAAPTPPEQAWSRVRRRRSGDRAATPVMDPGP